MKNLVRGFLLVVLAGALAVSASIAYDIHHPKAAAATEKLSVLWWVKVNGCPKGAFEVIVGMSDGHVVILDEDSPKEVLEAAAALIGDKPGAVRKFECGVIT